MYIDLQWANLNSGDVKLEIFRGDAPLDRAALANPIATLTAGETSYRDSDNIVLGKDYFYVFVTSNASDRVVSLNYRVQAVGRRGPGEQTLLQGNNELGYFGALSSADFINVNELVTRTNLRTQATSIVVAQPNPMWHKFVRKGKVLFIPERPVAYNVSWQHLYTLGMVYGRDDTGSNPLMATKVKQDAKVTIGADTYRVRLLKGSTDQDYEVWAASLIETYPEFDDLVYPLLHTVPDNQRLDNLTANGKYTGIDFMQSWSSMCCIPCQELTGSSTGQYRMTAVTAGQYDYANDLTTVLQYRAQVAITTVSSTYAWLPVLELIEG
jgi:hypothetical protein